MSRRSGGFPPRGFFEEDEPIFRRVPTEPTFPTIRISRGAMTWLVVLSLVLLLLLLLAPLAALYTDWLWFSSLGFSRVFGTRFWTQLTTFLIFATIFWIVGALNVLIALGAGRRLSTIGIRQRVITGPMTLLSLLGVFLLGLLFGRIGAGQWLSALAFLRQTPFGVNDPVWNKDVAFYVFTLPLYRFVWGWLLLALIVIIIGVGALYASRTGFQTIGLTGRAIRHLSVLGALFAVLLALNYRLDLYELLLDRHGVVFGAGYADLSARVPAYWIMFGLMILIAVGLLVNFSLARLSALAVAGGTWLVAVFLLLVIFPGVVQRFVVAPSELDREMPYLTSEIAFTRQAYGLAGIIDKPFTPGEAVTPEQITRNPDTVLNARLWDPIALLPTLNQVQGLRTYYEFSDVAIDRYRLGAEYRQLLLSAREILPRKLQQSAQSWVNLRLEYTHGYGVVANRANEATGDGYPVLTLRDIPPEGQPTVARPGIYFGRQTSEYVLVHSRDKEVDYPKGDANESTQWTGTTGVRLSSPLRRLALALRFGDLNIILSPQLSSDTQALFRRRVSERVRTLAPFLRMDNDPYVVVVDGKLYWIQDAYTVTDHYPYSQPSLDRGTSPIPVNYIRNSIKAVVDAYDGTTTLYLVDADDPVARTYSAIFPGLFHPFDEMPAGLRDHLRYPMDLFSMQADIFTLYHVQDPRVFYNKEDVWTVANEVLVQGQKTPIRPFYVVLRLPDERRAEFLTILPYTPQQKTNMIAYLAARSDPPNYGKLLDFRFSKDKLIVGPEQVEANIDQSPVIAPQFTLLSSQGSSIIRGNLLVLPIEDALLYVEPIYLQATGLRIPQLKKVIVATGPRVVMEDTLDRALAALFGTAPPVSPPPTTGPPTVPGGQVAALIAEANLHYRTALDLLKQGDFAGYAREIEQVGRILDQLLKLQQPAASPRPTPSPTR